MDSPSFVFKTEKNKEDERYSHTGMNVKTHTNHDGVRATARSLVIAVKQDSEVTSTALRVNKYELALISFWVR